MLETLETIPWDHLQHAYGAATDTPHHLRQLVTDDPVQFETAFEELNASICHQTTLYEATIYAIPFIVEILSATSHVQQQQWLLHWLTCMGNCDMYAHRDDPRHAHFIRYGEDWEFQDPIIQQRCHNQLAESIPVLIDLYSRLHDDANRALLLDILAGYRERALVILPHLSGWLALESSEVCQAKIRYCLQCLNA
jgi:hypothetical protein